MAHHKTPRPVMLRSKRVDAAASKTLVAVTPRQAGWKYVGFSVRQIASGERWSGKTGSDEMCAVLLEGRCHASWGGSSDYLLGPRKDVFSGYPHAIYLPPATKFSFQGLATTVLAECRAPATLRLPARIIRPEDCGFEIRGGGNATRQIVDILPPGFPAERLMICEVFTPGGNWSSYPPHKHDTDNPPQEADLEETYYYRFREPHAFGIQRLYRSGDRRDCAMTVRHGDLVIVRDGYHPFVSAYGHDAYYLNVLAGSRRSMAASDDPRYAAVRNSWPTPDPRLPLVKPPHLLGNAGSRP